MAILPHSSAGMQGGIWSGIQNGIVAPFLSETGRLIACERRWVGFGRVADRLIERGGGCRTGIPGRCRTEIWV